MSADPEAVLVSKRNLKRGLEAEIDEAYVFIQSLAPQFRMDTTGKRVTLLIEHLQKAGVLTEEQVLDYEIEVCKDIKEALAVPLRQAQAAKQQQGLAVVKKPTQLVDKNGRTLGGN